MKAPFIIEIRRKNDKMLYCAINSIYLLNKLSRNIALLNLLKWLEKSSAKNFSDII